jgi:hypothetical protein
MPTRRRLLKVATAAALPAASGSTASSASVADFAPALFELRSYLCRPGRRDELIAMFEDTFLDAYQAGGARIVASFRHLDEADRWVWIRAFRSAAERGRALQAFYSSAAWKARATPANATILNISDALLLREAGASAFTRFAPAPAASATRGAAVPDSAYRVEIYPLIKPLNAGSETQFPAVFEREAAPLLAALGAPPLASFITDRGDNSFPRQAVRADTTFVTLTRFASVDALAAFEAARAASADWRTQIAPALGRHLAAPAEVVRLQPTARSALR